MPRDIDPEVAQIDGVTLLDMDDLSSFAANGRMERANEVETVEFIVESEAKRFADVRSAREVAPLIASMRGAIEATRTEEVDKFARKAGYSDLERASLDQFTRSLVAKLLHEPTAALKEAAGSAKGDRLADSVRDLFDL